MTVSFKILRFNLFVNSFLPYIFTPEGIIRYGWTRDQVGKTCYLIGFYIDSKGVAGKDGIPCVVTIV